MDGIGGCIKSADYRAVIAKKIVIHIPPDFTESAQKLVKGIECGYLPEKDVMIELYEVNVQYSTEIHILKVHMAKRVITKSEFRYLQLHQIARYKEHFHNQWYRREDGSK